MVAIWRRIVVVYRASYINAKFDKKHQPGYREMAQLSVSIVPFIEEHQYKMTESTNKRIFLINF